MILPVSLLWRADYQARFFIFSTLAPVLGLFESPVVEVTLSQCSSLSRGPKVAALQDVLRIIPLLGTQSVLFHSGN